MNLLTNPTETAARQVPAENQVPAEKALISHVADQDGGSHSGAAAGADRQGIAAATAAAVTAGKLPALVIDQPQAQVTPLAKAATKHHWYDGTLAVSEDIAEGSYHELTQHPLRVLASFGIGVGTAAIASVVAAPVAIGATVAGLGYGAYQIYKHAPGWVESAEELNHPELHTQSELAQAHKTWQNFGGGATDLAAGIAGGVAYRAASSAISTALEDSAEAHPVKTAAAASATSNDGGASSQAAASPGDGGASSQAAPTPGDGGASSHAAATTAPTDGGSSAHGAIVTGHEGSIAHHALAAGQSGDTPPSTDIPATEESLIAAQPNAAVPAEIEPKAAAPATVAPKVEAPATGEAAAPAMTPEELALANSVKTNQAAFAAASDQDNGSGIVESVKQLYNVRFDKVTADEGQRIFTLENRTEGVLMPKGTWIATRLDASGNPVMEDGIQNSWSMTDPKILKTYQVDQGTIASSNSFVASTRTDGPSVHMVQLDKPISIVTKWGAMQAKIGDWLANYDFDKTTGTPGKDYAIVSGESYRQTYQPKAKI